MDTVELLKGVEILSVNEGMPMGMAILLLGFCLVALVLTIYLIVISIGECSAGGLFLSLLLFGTIGILTGVVLDESFNPTPIYKVIVNDSVSMNEFYDRYKVISTEGKIYSIQIKEK